MGIDDAKTADGTRTPLDLHSRLGVRIGVSLSTAISIAKIWTAAIVAGSLAALLFAGVCMGSDDKPPAAKPPAFTYFLQKHPCKTKNASCPALEDATVDVASTVFVKRIRKRVRDSTDYSSSDADYIGPFDCESLAHLRGISMLPLKTIEQVREHYDLFCENSGYLKQRFIERVRLSTGAGKVRHTPLPNDPDHHDLYRADEFELESHVETIGKSIKIGDFIKGASWA